MKLKTLIWLPLLVVAGCDRALDTTITEDDGIVLVMVDGRPVTLPMLEVLMTIRGVDENDEEGMRQLLDELVRIRVMANAAEEADLAEDAHVRAERKIKDMETLYVRYLEKNQMDHPVDDAAIEQVYREQVERSGDRQYLIESIVYDEQIAALGDIAEVEDLEGSGFDQLRETARSEGRVIEQGLWVDRSQLPESFAAELMRTEIGQIVPTLLQAGNEWRLVRVQDTRPLDAPDLEAVRDGIRRHLLRRQTETLVEELYQAADIVPMLPLEPAGD